MSYGKLAAGIAGMVVCAGALAQEAPKAEAPAQGDRLRPGRLMEQADTDKDGKVSFEELKKIAPNFTEERFKALDKDADGKLTREEMPRGGQGMLERADKDGDKKISKEEYMGAFPNAEEERFTRMDKNSDGFIEQSELPKRPGGPGRNGGPGGEGGGRFGQMFERADADKDGKVTADEFKTVAPNAPEDRFTGMDRNGDGVLTTADFGGAAPPEKPDAPKPSLETKAE